ncbi:MULTISPECIES: shikimate kinase [unclassified Roseburia]|jgi:shikimate kinase|uniref:shikimate kinase n=1 Tax=unclassified Roseburia TaxID=2637578 RepID=UPI000E435E6A|nr:MULTISPECIES: shikimate kinase [unclassified Roseburia]RGF43426.1 shikimate kinase [Roseburia sp. AF42-8]RHQ39975.1 shikimate kinase [Roseburia sp. AF25-25LB]RHQ43704.1 shikimate kinase [Roseburia sp. AF25-18LB]RHQ50252.1 shikimate kinase [Roseburia sp. AF25-13LB]RHQ50428.1 shikimate kinase [Roseburia sp. AF25-15LB]
MKDNIVLIGMPGVGKSTVGVVLAKALGYNFVDADLVIQQQTGKLLCELIAEHGTEGFLEIEDEVNSRIEGHKAVIATGGSAVYCANAMEHYKEIATVLYLSVSYETLEERLGDLKNRGVVLNDGQTLKDLYDERTAYYEKYADVTVNEEGLSIRETIDAVKEKLGME